MKIVSLIAMAFFMIASPVLCANSYDSPLKNWSIPVIQIADDNRAPSIKRNPGDETICAFGPRWPQYIYLTRPDEKNYVGIVKYEPCSPAILNPNDGFDYGPIPPLTTLRLNQANILWGKPITSQGINTYKLTTKPFNQEYFFDVCFSDEGVQKYRVRTKAFERFDNISSDGQPHLSAWQLVR